MDKWTAVVVIALCAVAIAFFLGPCDDIVNVDTGLSSSQRVELEKLKIVAEECPCMKDVTEDGADE